MLRKDIKCRYRYMFLFPFISGRLRENFSLKHCLISLRQWEKKLPYIFVMSSHWLRTCSTIDRKWAQSLYLFLARSKLRLCSANHRAGYFSNLACDWLSIVWAYSEQETENDPMSCMCRISKIPFKIPHKISYPYIERYDFYTTWKF